MSYWRPLAQTGRVRPEEARPLAGGWCWFTHVARLGRDAAPEVVPAEAVPGDALARLTAPRAPLAGLAFDRPRIMAILNVTPDSFSDGGRFAGAEEAAAEGRAAAAAGAEILDIGGESTRPGAETVPAAEELARAVPVVRALADGDALVSIDTRKAAVAREAVAAGAGLVNDVSAMTFDPAMAGVVAASGWPVCLMHARGDPRTMQDAPAYDDVLLDVYDHLADRVAAAERAGIGRERIVLDPGIGFGKTLDHNLALLEGLSLFHGLGCPILLGASRKGLIGTVGAAPQPADRMPGSVGVALAALAQGVHILRVHDVAATRQALRLWLAATQGRTP